MEVSAWKMKSPYIENKLKKFKFIIKKAKKILYDKFKFFEFIL
jgi:hypothetical protein